MSRMSHIPGLLQAMVLMAGIVTADERVASLDSFKPFKLRTPEGTEVALSELLRKATLVVFFFPTCGFCNAAFPGFQRLHDVYQPHGLSSVWINVAPEQEPLIADWRRRHQSSVPILLGRRSVQQDYKLTMTPTHYLLDPDGHVLWRHAGYATGDEKMLESHIRDALGLAAGAATAVTPEVR